MSKLPKPPRGPRNLKAGGFTNGLWRLEERAESLRRRSGPSVCSSEAASALRSNEPEMPGQPRFQETFCSQCGGSFGPGESGFSHCDRHRTLCPVKSQKWNPHQPCPVCGALGPWFENPLIGECVSDTSPERTEFTGNVDYGGEKPRRPRRGGEK